ncbi:S-layer homology domain-containing protein [Bacilliculturomica massiliensis]|uniref:S-layer homology domain-containing protein n=1 Tax=Bacilliculturomica massiliensis TaxID=1917867 RepID=UPI00103097D3|nr:S-layer homology domain-containing protein [Bacilliculturomica massiliensis]
MRKVLSFVLVLSLVLGSFGMCFAATATTPSTLSLSDINGQDCEDAVRVLTSLDVVSGYEDGTYKPEQTVTRAEMASLIIKALGLKETDAVPKFADSRTHWAKGYIAYANTLGIISGRSETVFDPDATVTYDEATTMLIKALGYTDESLVGTYPASFVSRAKVLGILDGIQTGTAGANRGDIAIMLYQTLDQAIGKVDKDGNFVATVIEWSKNGGNATDAKKYDTMLDRLGADIVDGDSKYADVDDEAFMIIGDEDSLINLTPYRGALVSAYANSDDDIIAIKEVFTTFISGNFDNADFDTDTPFILSDGAEYTMKKDALTDLDGGSKYDVVTFLNGDDTKLDGQSGTLLAYLQTHNNADDQTRTAFTLSVELSGKKIENIYAIQQWAMKDGTQVDADDIKDIDANHKLLGVDFTEDNNGDIDLDEFELLGVESLDKIAKDNVVYVYDNNDKEIERIAVGTETISGEVTKTNAAKTKITIDGKTYKYASVELDGNKIVNDAVAAGKIEAGDEVKLYLDAYGYIFDYDEISGQADNYAIVLETENKDGNKISSGAKIKLFLADGTAKVFDVDEDEILDAGIIDSTDSDTVKSDGTKGASAAGTDGHWNNTTITAGSIIKYGVDKSGTITDIEAKGAYNTTDNGLDVRTASGEDITAKGYYGGQEIGKDAVIFNYDYATTSAIGGDLTDDDNYSVAKYDNILDSENVTAFYVYDKDDKEITAMLLFDVSSGTDVYGVVVGNKYNTSDSEGEFDMLIDGKPVTYNGKDTLVGKGYNNGGGRSGNDALYRVKFDADGDISSFEDWYTSGDKVLKAQINMSGGRTATLNSRVFKASVAFDTVTAAGFSNNTSAAGKITDEVTLDRDAYVYKYSYKDGEWQLGSTSDLRSLNNGTSNGDIVTFYDVVDEDGVFDVVLIWEKSSGATTGTNTGSVTYGNVSSMAITFDLTPDTTTVGAIKSDVAGNSITSVSALSATVSRAGSTSELNANAKINSSNDYVVTITVTPDVNENFAKAMTLTVNGDTVTTYKRDGNKLIITYNLSL